MSVIIKGGGPNVAIASETASFAEMGFNSANILIVFEVGDILKSWKPGRTINPISGITAGMGYYIVPVIDIDVTEYFRFLTEWQTIEW